MRSLSDTLFFTKVCFHSCVQIITKLQRSFTGCKRGIVIVWCVVLVIRSQILTSRVRSFSLMQAGSFRLDLRHNTMEVVNGNQGAIRMFICTKRMPLTTVVSNDDMT